MARPTSENEEDSIKVETRLNQKTYEAIERWRKGLEVIPPRATVIRNLIERAVAQLQLS